MRLASHAPIRSCTGCGVRAPKAQLLRFVAAKSGLEIDVARRLPGRGAYLHADDSCWQAFVARKPPLRSLRRSVDRNLRAALVEELRHLVR